MSVEDTLTRFKQAYPNDTIVVYKFKTGGAGSFSGQKLLDVGVNDGYTLRVYKLSKSLGLSMSADDIKVRAFPFVYETSNVTSGERRRDILKEKLQKQFPGHNVSVFVFNDSCWSRQSINTKEFVFRSSILCLLYSHVSLFSAIFISPLFFGLAHFHHMLEHFKQNSYESYHRLSSMRIILIHLFQFSYTYIFGVYSSFLFIRTGHFIPSFIIHSLCNSLGVPNINSLVNMKDKYIKRRFVFIMCYLIGLWLFSINLFFLTQSKFYYSNEKNLIIYRHWSS